MLLQSESLVPTMYHSFTNSIVKISWLPEQLRLSHGLRLGNDKP